MKKLFLAIAAVAMLLTSCSKDDGLTGVSKSQVTFTVSSPEMATRYGEGEKATTLYYAVYDAVEGGLVEGLSQLAGEDFTGGEKQVTINLVEGRTYSIIFYAQNAAETPYYVNWQSQVLYIPEPAKLLSNKETYDAFYAHEDNLKIGNAAINKTITLRRPFAQLNILTSQNDIDLAKKAGIEVKNTAVTVKKIYTQMNLMNDAVVKESETAVTFGLNTPAEGTYTIDGTDYKWLAMNYLLVNEQKMVDVEFTMEDTTVAAGQDNMLLRKYGSIHVERNHRTNIYGALITNPAIFNVKIDEEFYKPDYDYFEADVWDGESATSLTPALDENGEEIYVNAEGAVVPQGTSNAYKLYEIEDAADAAGFRNQVMGIANGTTSEGVQKQLTRGEEAPNTFANAYIKLMTDIDLNWEEWVPIGNSNNKFRGIFDGNGHTIRNLQVSGNNSNVGLFGMTTDREIKNLTVENAKVSGRLNVGVVAGTPYTSKFTNIKVTGHVEVNGMSYVGGVGGKNAYANWTNVTVDVDNTSYVKANSVENGTVYRTYVGGVVGFNGEGNHTFKNITSNIDVEGSTCDVGGMFGIAHYGNKFENCSSSGDVKITNASDASDAEEIGGIAGVWHNQNGTQVTFTNCSFTGNLSVNVDGVDLSDNTIVGAAYIESGLGKLIINGTDVTMTATALAAALTADVEEINITLGANINVPISSLGTITGGSGEYKLGGESTKKINLNLNGHKLNITTTYWSNIGAKNPNALFTIKNGTMTSSQTSGTWNSYDVTFSNCDYVIEDVVFDKAIAFDNTGKSVSLKNVTINETHDYYALWICAAGQKVTIDGLTVNSDGRGIKIDEQYVGSPAKVALNINNAKFTTKKKAAIMVKSAAGAEINASNLNIEGVAADKVNAVWVDADAAEYANLVTATGATVVVEK